MKREHNIPIVIYFFVIVGIFTILNFSEGFDDLNRIERITDDAVNLWGGIRLISGADEAYGSSIDKDVYRLDNGYSVVKDSDHRMDGFYAGVNRGLELAEETGAHFLFTAAPEKQRAEDIPKGIVDYASVKYETAMTWLNDNNIDYIDMKKLIEDSGEDWYSYFYSSDHHWNNEAAYMCVEAITGYMSDAGLEVIRPDRDKLEWITYQNAHLGSSGRFSGIYFGGVDDYTLIKPDQVTSMILNMPSENVCLEGSFEDTVIDDVLTEYSFSRYAYYDYFGTDRDYTEIINNDNRGKARVVMVKDSYGIPVAALLSLYCYEIDVVDLRYISDGSAAGYIADKNPDVIIYLFEPGNYGEISAMMP